MKNNNISCPVDFVTVNEYKVRTIAFFVFIFSIYFLLTGHWFIPVFLCVDFYIRTFTNGKLSVLGHLADFIINSLSLKNKPVDRAPKRFAAQIGFIVTLIISISVIVNWTYVSFAGAVIMIMFSALESFIGFCAGCYVYHFYKKLTA